MRKQMLSKIESGYIENKWVTWFYPNLNIGLSKPIPGFQIRPRSTPDRVGGRAEGVFRE
jgi:hypothetical protein